MIGRALHYLSLVASLFVLASFGLFALAQVSHASSTQVNAVAGQRSAAPHQVHRTGQPRRLIDEVAGKLTSPFDGIVPSDDVWVNHAIPALLALLVFGAGVGFLGRWASGRAGGGPAAEPHSYV
jgi:hypothetical protein